MAAQAEDLKREAEKLKQEIRVNDFIISLFFVIKV